MHMLKRTPLFEEHRKLAGKMVDFGGWELPVQYSGLAQEHQAVRTACGIFDVSHMGEILVSGPGSLKFVNHVTTNDASSLSVLQAQYSAFCRADGGVIDDLVVYRLGEEEFLLVVNAANIEKDFEHLQVQLAKLEGPRPLVKNESSHYAQIAVQGPLSERILQRLTSTPLHEIRTYWFRQGEVSGVSALIARTGYTGEDGFEIYLSPDHASRVWTALLEAGTPDGLVPCGLGARDTLRLEMKYALYGHELTDETNPLEVGLGWITKMGKADFVGKDFLTQVKAQGPMRSLVGITGLGRGIPRQGYEIYDAESNRCIGKVTSGTLSPTLKKPIGIGLIEKSYEKVGTQVRVKIREEFHEFLVCKTPFIEKTQIKTGEKK